MTHQPLGSRYLPHERIGQGGMGAHLVQSTCSDSSDHAQFRRNEDAAAGSDYHFVNYHSGMCMGVQGSSLKSGAKVLQGNCSSNGTQIWLTAAGI